MIERSSRQSSGDSERLRYTPPDHQEQLEKLEREDAVCRAKQLSGDSGGIETPASQAAQRIEQGYQRARWEEEQIANEHLLRLAEPFLPDPSPEQWGIVGVVTEQEADSLRVPFTQAEITAIATAREARSALGREGSTQSSVAREFVIDSQLFPEEIKNGPLSIGLSHRPSSIWGIMIAARAAEDSLTSYTGTSWEPRGKTRVHLEILRDLPDKLMRHQSTERK
jgi:hypothetical protein